jgi:hypothetical protein
LDNHFLVDLEAADLEAVHVEAVDLEAVGVEVVVAVPNNSAKVG